MELDISQFTILRTSKQIRLRPDKSIRGHNFDGNNMDGKTSPICSLVQCSLTALNSMFCGLTRSGRLLTQIQMSRMTYIGEQFRRLRSIHFNMTKRWAGWHSQLANILIHRCTGSPTNIGHSASVSAYAPEWGCTCPQRINFTEASARPTRRGDLSLRWQCSAVVRNHVSRQDHQLQKPYPLATLKPLPFCLWTTGSVVDCSSLSIHGTRGRKLISSSQ